MASQGYNPLDVMESRINEDYIVNQVNSMRETDSHRNHKDRIREFDTLYRGELTNLFPEEVGLTNRPVVENKVKNATHDIARLAGEARGTPAFPRLGDKSKDLTDSRVRAVIADTIWKFGGGDRLEKQLYIDLIAAGYFAVSVYFNKNSDYPQFLRLDPRQCYPDVVNGVLNNMLYIENMPERKAAMLFPEAGLNEDLKNTKNVMICTLFTDKEVVLAVANEVRGSAKNAYIVQRWEHGLGCVPVAWRALPSADGTYHGLFDQLGGPLMIRNKIIRLMADYIESTAHAPFEAKNILNEDEEPSPTTIYRHDPNSNDSFMRRVAPASQSGSLFGLLQYLDSQEQAEAIQPPARIGVVSQSIASGSFVASTQGSLSSVVKELQEIVADGRYEAHCIAFKIDAKSLDREKPLLHAVGNKATYTPSKDMGDYHYHTVSFGAGAGLNRSEADTRILQHLGAGLIPKEEARGQLEYVGDITTLQEAVDREELANVFFQRFAGDPNTPMSTLARAVIMMVKDGKNLMEVLEEIAPELVEAEQTQRALDAAKTLPQPGPEGVTPAENQEALQAGSTEPSQVEPEFAPRPFSQIVTRNPVR